MYQGVNYKWKSITAKSDEYKFAEQILKWIQPNGTYGNHIQDSINRHECFFFEEIKGSL